MEILSDLEIHGVKVDKICVSTPFRALTARELHQLTAAELGTDIEIVYLEEAIFFAATGSREERGPVTVEPRSDDLSFKISEDQLDDYARRPFWRVKRIFDVVLALSLACLFSPFIFCVAILAAVDVGLPVVFWQQRPGVGGHPFRVYKFRTMAAAHDADGHRVNDEARSSAVGRFLRRSRLDELPQLYNILIGDMSFVGPRPLLPGDQPIGSAVRTLIRPGLTGWAQINGGRRRHACRQGRARRLVSAERLAHPRRQDLCAHRADGHVRRTGQSTRHSPGVVRSLRHRCVQQG